MKNLVLILTFLIFTAMFSATSSAGKIGIYDGDWEGFLKDRTNNCGFSPQKGRVGFTEIPFNVSIINEKVSIKSRDSVKPISMTGKMLSMGRTLFPTKENKWKVNFLLPEPATIKFKIDPNFPHFTQFMDVFFRIDAHGCAADGVLARVNKNDDEEVKKQLEVAELEKKQIQLERDEKERKRKEAIVAKERKKRIAEQLKKQVAKKKKLEDTRRKIAENKKRAQEKKIIATKLAKEKRNALLEEDINRNTAFRLFVGDPKDIVFLINARSKNVTRVLSGEMKIISPTARICAISPTSFKPSNTRYEKEAFDQLINAVKPSKVEHNSERGVAPCKDLSEEKSEIIIFNRNISSSVTFDTLSKLIKNTTECLTCSIKGVVYNPIFVSDYQIFDEKIQSEKQAILELERKRKERQIQIENGINEGTMVGFGMFELKSAKSNAICIEEGNNQGDIVHILQNDILQNVDGNYWQYRFSKKRITPVRTKVSDIEKVFLSMKTQQCGSFFGKTESIKVLTSALIRDEIKFQILPVLIDNNYFVKRQNKINAETQKLNQESKVTAEKSAALKQVKNINASNEATPLKTKSTSSGTGYGRGSSQQIFMTEFITGIKAKINDDDNTAKKKRIWRKASNELCSSTEFNALSTKVDWVGFVDSIVAKDDGSVILELDIDTHGNEVNGDVPKNLLDVVLELKEGGLFEQGELVKFSGNFEKGKASEGECLKTVGLDSNPELKGEVFSFKYTIIEQINQ